MKMIHIIFILILLMIGVLVSLSFAEGPLYKSKDVIAQQEFDNVYQDIRTVKFSTAQINSILASTNTFTGQNNFLNDVRIGTTSSLAGHRLTVKGGNAAEIAMDNDGSQYTGIAFYNNGIGKASIDWDNTNTDLYLNNGTSGGTIPLHMVTNSLNAVDINYLSNTETRGLSVTNLNTGGGYGSGITFQSVRADNLAVAVAGRIGMVGAENWANQSAISSDIIFYTVIDSTLTQVGSFVSTKGGGFTALGTNSNDSASTGYIGEYKSSSTAGVLINAVASAQYWDIGSSCTITLTAGDWDISSVCEFARNGATVTSASLECGIGTAGGNSSAGLVAGDNNVLMDVAALSFTRESMSVPSARVSITGSTTYHLKGFPGTYTGGPVQARGRISARRIR